MITKARGQNHHIMAHRLQCQKIPWHTFDDAYELYQRLGLDGLFIALPGDRSITASDLDDCFENGSLKSDAQTIVNDLNTYTEYIQAITDCERLISARSPEMRAEDLKSIQTRCMTTLALCLSLDTATMARLGLSMMTKMR